MEVDDEHNGVGGDDDGKDRLNELPCCKLNPTSSIIGKESKRRKVKKQK